MGHCGEPRQRTPAMLSPALRPVPHGRRQLPYRAFRTALPARCDGSNLRLEIVLVDPHWLGSNVGLDLASSGNKALETPFDFPARQEHAATTGLASEPDVGAEPDDTPFKATAWMRLLESHDVAKRKCDELRRHQHLPRWIANTSFGLGLLHQAGDLHSTGERAHFLFRDRGCPVHSILNGRSDEILEHFDIFRVDRCGVDLNSA